MRPEASPCDPEQGLFGANGPSQEGNDPRGIKIVASAQFIARCEVPHTYKSMYAPPSAIALTHSIGILFPRVAPASSRQWKVPPRWQRYALRKSRCAAGVPPAPEPPRWRRYAPRPGMWGHMRMRHPNVPGHPNVGAVREPPHGPGSLGGAYIVVYVCDPRRRLATRSRGRAAQMVPHTYKPMYAPPSVIALVRSTGILFPRVAPASSRQWKVPPRWQRYALPKSRCVAGVSPAPEPPRWRRYAPRP
jgi:hypothetical protein